jgi:hypothetical protein
MKEALEALVSLTMGVGFLSGFAVLWCWMCWFLSRIGGWASLAGVYPAGDPPAGPSYDWRSLRIAPLTGYNNCMNVRLSPQGIYMMPLVLFRFGHRALLIPWDCVAEIQERRFLGTRLLVAMRANGRKLTLDLPAAAKDGVRQYAPHKLPVD